MMDIDMPDAPQPQSPTYPPLKRRRESDSESTRASSSQSHFQPSIPYSISPNGDALSSSKRRQLESQVLQRRVSLSQRVQPPDGLIRPTYKPYWHDDGDLVIVVDNHIFKLPRMWLLSSEIFEDMFLLALPPNPSTSMESTYAGIDAQEMFEGCPVIHLSDKAQDWMSVLRYLDNPRNYQLDSPADDSSQFWGRYNIPYETIASVLRISSKYEMAELRKTAAKHVFRLWPPSIRKMDERAFSHERLDAISLARECDLPEMLPSIFYSLCIDMHHNSLSPTLRTHLSRVDQLRILQATPRLSAFHKQTLDKASFGAACEHQSCAMNLDNYWAQAIEAVDKSACSNSPGSLSRPLVGGMTRGWDSADVGGWMMRALLIMLENRVEKVCRDCMDLHWEYVDERMRMLEMILPRFLGL